MRTLYGDIAGYKMRMHYALEGKTDYVVLWETQIAYPFIGGVGSDGSFERSFVLWSEMPSIFRDDIQFAIAVPELICEEFCGRWGK